jgi:Rhodopirellula transposase DDE domain
MLPYLNEQTKRIWAAAEALALGRSGNAMVAEATGMSRTTLTKAKQEVVQSPGVPQRQRRPGGGRKQLTETAPTLLEALDALIAPRTRGDPTSPWRWTSKSPYHLADAFTAQGHPVSQRTVYRLLEALGSSLQANRQTDAGKDHPDREAQFQCIYAQVRQFQRHTQPVISVDTKQKATSGQFANKGQEWAPHGQPTRVKTHDCPEPQPGKASP